MGKINTTLRQARRSRTLSQEQMARLLGVRQQTLSKYEHGIVIPPKGMQIRIAAILGQRVEDLWPEAVTV